MLFRTMATIEVDMVAVPTPEVKDTLKQCVV
jgi:hypothetical protein